MTTSKRIFRFNVRVRDHHYPGNEDVKEKDMFYVVVFLEQSSVVSLYVSVCIDSSKNYYSFPNLFRSKLLFVQIQTNKHTHTHQCSNTLMENGNYKKKHVCM